jgi:hypothetical protein
MSTIGDEADRQLQALRLARDAATTNLLDLENDGTYTLLKAGDGLSGATAHQAKPALAKVDELWRGLQLLNSLVDQAETQRGSGHLSDGRARELLELLTGPSITLPTEVRPLAQRVLTASPVATPTLTPQQLIAVMEAAFVALRDVVAQVDRAWKDLLPRLERATAEAARLVAELPHDRTLTAAQAALRPLADRVAHDPLGAADELRRAESALTAARHAAASARARAVQVREGLAAGDQLIVDVAALIDKGRTALDESRRVAASPTGLLDPLDPTVLTAEQGLQPWLARLQALAAEGDLDRAAVGLERWSRVADQTLAAARQVAEANTRPAARRQELRGLLRAARAKAAASGRAEDTGLRDLEEKARAALATPCDLAAADAAVVRYLRTLRSGRRRPSRPHQETL